MKQLLHLLLLLCLSANAQEKFTVYFDFDKDVPNKASIKAFNTWAKNNNFITIQSIEGYTDASGADVYNQDLSERRAMRVYEMLKSYGMQMNDTEKIGYGESRALGIHTQNRKVIISYYERSIMETVETKFSNEIKNAKVGDIIRLKNVNFLGGTTYIVKESRPALKELLNLMLSHPKLKIDIQGHICCEVEDVDNLSGRRAEEIFLYLTNNGIDKSRVTIRGYGGHRPLQNNIQLIQNRRVEIEIISN